MTMTGFYEEAIAKAIEEGEKAGAKWIEDRLTPGIMNLVLEEDRAYITNAAGVKINPMLDLCGGASIQLKGKRSGIYKWLKKTQPDRQHYGLYLNHKFGVWQDMGLKEAIIRRAYEVLTKEYGIDGITYSTYID